MLHLRYGNVEIKKQTQIFVTVSYYFRMQEYRKKLLMSKQISDDIKQFSYETVSYTHLTLPTKA